MGKKRGPECPKTQQQHLFKLSFSPTVLSSCFMLQQRACLIHQCLISLQPNSQLKLDAAGSQTWRATAERVMIMKITQYSTVQNLGFQNAGLLSCVCIQFGNENELLVFKKKPKNPTICSELNNTGSRDLELE